MADLIKAGTKNGRLHIQLESWLYDTVMSFASVIGNVRDIVRVFGGSTPAVWNEVKEIALTIQELGLTFTFCLVSLAILIAHRLVSVGRKMTVNAPTASVVATPLPASVDSTVTTHPPE